MKLTVESMTYGPDGLAHTEEGKAVFVSGAVVGDTVEAEVIRDGASFCRARTTKILEASPWRTTAPCPYISVCGGCPWGELALSEQHRAKTNNLRMNLMRIGKYTSDQLDTLIQPLRASQDAWGYRNKIELAPCTVRGKVSLGMHGRQENEIIAVESCPLFEKKFSRAVKAVRGALSYLANSRELDLERIGIRGSRRTGNLEVALWTAPGSFPRSLVARVLGDAVHPSSTVRVMTKGDTRARKIAGVEALAGEGSWSESIGHETMRLSAPSFFQVNTSAAEILVELVMDMLKPQTHEHAVDLYSGAGTFSLPLARQCSWVSAVEAYGPAVRDLRRNAASAGLDSIEVIGGDAVLEFPEEDADILVVDPPRAGLDIQAIHLIASTSARDVAYVSCDPATLARDLRRFEDEGALHAVRITPVDLFPQTFHCETVVHLTRR